MTRIEALRYCSAHSSNASFVANVISCQHSNAALKLKGLAHLLEQGKVVTLGQFSIDTLLVDGYTFPWTKLEDLGRLKG